MTAYRPAAARASDATAPTIPPASVASGDGRAERRRRPPAPDDAGGDEACAHDRARELRDRVDEEADRDHRDERAGGHRDTARLVPSRSSARLSPLAVHGRIVESAAGNAARHRANGGAQQGSSPYLLLITGLFVMALVLSNVLAVKLVEINGRVFDAATLLFPLTYLIGDVLTEVYGYRQARLVIWVGFVSSLVAVVAIQIAILLPPAGFWEENQAAYESVLDTTWRIFLGSLAAYLVGEFTNSFILAKLKVLTRGRWLWLAHDLVDHRRRRGSIRRSSRRSPSPGRASRSRTRSSRSG